MSNRNTLFTQSDLDSLRTAMSYKFPEASDRTAAARLETPGAITYVRTMIADLQGKLGVPGATESIEVIQPPETLFKSQAHEYARNATKEEAKKVKEAYIGVRSKLEESKLSLQSLVDYGRRCASAKGGSWPSQTDYRNQSAFESLKSSMSGLDNSVDYWAQTYGAFCTAWDIAGNAAEDWARPQVHDGPGQ